MRVLRQDAHGQRQADVISFRLNSAAVAKHPVALHVGEDKGIRPSLFLRVWDPVFTVRKAELGDPGRQFILQKAERVLLTEEIPNLLKWSAH